MNAYNFSPGERVKYQRKFRETQYGLVSSVNDYTVWVKFDMPHLCIIGLSVAYTSTARDPCYLTIVKK